MIWLWVRNTAIKKNRKLQTTPRCLFQWESTFLLLFCLSFQDCDLCNWKVTLRSPCSLGSRIEILWLSKLSLSKQSNCGCLSHFSFYKFCSVWLRTMCLALLLVSLYKVSLWVNWAIWAIIHYTVSWSSLHNKENNHVGAHLLLRSLDVIFSISYCFQKYWRK